ncbi:hypothetical protein MYSEV_167 [Mythimna separata entomopoxvirus 'L']|uniref:Uncharacterized protein n=1 Tax=Mythimna separata entomopoxvirus 'L' TaxID=1293572 RepID=A0A916P1X8_9POXV|nr:hypothetical protein MYSEV_167 [Mythimna separata entomopoxvirus 'L']CCU56365.1 hypothetical protein MYSEV_167 [Mythimna separata entomopoxvirus 'L']
METVIDKYNKLSIQDDNYTSDSENSEDYMKENDKELIYKDYTISIKNIDIPDGDKYYIICMCIYDKVGDYAIKFEKYKSNLNLTELTNLIFKNFVYIIPGVIEMDRTDIKKYIYHDTKNEYYEIYILEDKIYMYIGTSDKHETYDNTYDGVDKFLNRNEGIKKNNLCSII